MALLSGAGTPLGALFGLVAAVSWGGGDFAGGMGVKTAGGTARGALRVIVAGHALSLLVLSVILFGTGGVHWQVAAGTWALGAGVVAGLSLAGFYIALARGAMGASAAVSGLLAAAIPAAIGIALEGRPGRLALLGFALAAVAIWMIAAPSGSAPEAAVPSSTMALAVGGGIGFGLYFTALKFANPLGVVAPMALARVGSLLTCLALLLVLSRGPKDPQSALRQWLPWTGWLWAAGVALLDTGGNLFYLAATRAGRLDVAAVLASLYPASTILLAAAVLHERPSRRQVFGMAAAAVAVAMITL